MGLYQAIRKDREFKFLLVGVGLSLFFELSSLLSWSWPAEWRLITALVLIFLVAWDVFKDGLKAIKELNFKSINLLMTLAAIGAFLLGEYEEGCVILVLFALAEKLEDYGFQESKSTIESLLSCVPKTANRVQESIKTVPVKDLAVGDLILIRPGEMIPVDGKVHSGQSLVDESSITGEPLAQEKHQADLVFAGSLNQQGSLTVQVLKTFQDSTLSQIVQLTLSANSEKSETETFIRKFTSLYTPTILILTLAIITLPPLILNPQSKEVWLQWFKQGLSLLVISCPCALVISTPLSIYAAMTNAARHGLMIKGGKYLELMARVKIIALDKTRTLTLGKPQVSRVIPLAKLSSEEVLACAAGLETHSEHPLAESLISYAKSQSIQIHKPSEFKSAVGLGISSDCLTCQDGKHYLGKLEYIESQIQIPQIIKQKILDLKSTGETIMVVSSSEEVQGVITFTDTIKSETKESLDKLKKLGLHPVILTGDHSSAAQKVAQEIGIKDVFADLQPSGKSDIIKEFEKQNKKTVMVGDGVNDAPALAHATVSIAMGAAGNDTAIETAKISILNDHLGLIPALITLARKTLATIKFNTWIAVITKFIFLILAFSGHGQLVLAIIADVGLTLFVVLNSLRLAQTRIES